MLTALEGEGTHMASSCSLFLPPECPAGLGSGRPPELSRVSWQVRKMVGGTCDPARGLHVPRPKGLEKWGPRSCMRRQSGQREELRLEALPKIPGQHESAFSGDHLYYSVGCGQKVGGAAGHQERLPVSRREGSVWLC